jgi:heptosyltransferase II
VLPDLPTELSGARRHTGFARARGTTSVKGRSLDTSKINNILVRSTNWIGDAVMTTPALGAIRQTFPQARITVLATPLVAQLFSPHDCVDEVMLYDRQGRHKGLAGRFRIASELRARRFDLAILLQNAIDAALITRLAGIPRRMGARTDGRGFLLTHGFDHKVLDRRLHHVDTYLELLKHFGICAKEKKQLLCVTDLERESARERLFAAGVVPGDFLIGINPGAAYGSAKRWYPERFAAAGAELAQKWGAKILVFGGPGEVAIANDIEGALQGNCLNLAGKLTVRELMALIQRCDFFISNDSGPMHLAAAFGVPLVAIFGSTDHRTTYPYSGNSVIVRREVDCAPCLKRECPIDHRCMKGVTADDVVAAAVKLRG